MRKLTLLLIGLLALQARAAPEAPLAVAVQTLPSAIDAELARRGNGVFDRFCISCHGERGDGRGKSAAWLNPKPRDFTGGVFKFRSTPSGALPTSDDLLRTLTRGIHSTNMPSWGALGDRNLRAVAEYIKTFSPRWQKEALVAPLVIPVAVPDSASVRAKGREVYGAMGCANCHGSAGRGDGPSVPELKDDWGEKIVPFDFTGAATLKAGDRPEDLYRTFMTGLNGTPMPSFADSLTPEDAWALVHYLRSLRDGAGEHSAMATASAREHP